MLGCLNTHQIMPNLAEILSKIDIPEALPSDDDTEGDARAAIAQLEMIISTANFVLLIKNDPERLSAMQHVLSELSPEYLALTEEDVNRLRKLSNEVNTLLAKYTILKATAVDLYKRYQVEKPKLALSKAESQPVRQLKKTAHETALAALAPGAVITAIEKREQFITQTGLEEAYKNLSRYFRVREVSSRSEATITVTTELVAEQIVERLKANTKTNTVVVTAPPGSGKTTFMNNMDVLLRNEGWVVVQINFDKIIGAFFAKEGKPTKDWSGKTAEEFDHSFFDLEKIVARYYPEAYKAQGKRFIVMIDTLGYSIDEMLYGLELIQLLRSSIDSGEALVVSIIAQNAVVEYAKEQREKGKINAKDPKAVARQLKKGATADAVTRHHQQLDKKIKKISHEGGFQRLFTKANIKSVFPHIPNEEITNMTERLAFAIITKNNFNINANWWFVLNLFQPEGEEFVLPPTKEQPKNPD